MAAALADAAVCNHILVGGDAFSAVDSFQFVRALKGTISRDSSSPGHVGCTGDVSTALRALLGQIGRSQQLAAVLTGGAYINQGHIRLAQFVQDLIAISADRLIGLASLIVCLWVGRHLGGQLAIIGQPLYASAIEQAGILVTV